MNLYESMSIGIGIIVLVGGIVKYGISQADKRDLRFEKNTEQITTAMNAGIDKLAAGKNR